MARRVFAPLMAGLLATSPVSAQSLVMAFSGSPTSADPHYHTFSPNIALDSHSYNTLVDMDPKSRPIASLAESWRLVSPDTWEFKLRPGVKFHNGDDFTAEDVVYTLARVPTVLNSPGSFSIYTKSVVSSEVVDPHTIRLKTNGLYPLLPIDLTLVFMIPRRLGPNPLNEDFNNGRNAIGTGPYRMTSYKPGDRVELERFDGFWGKKPHWANVSVRMIPNDGARTASLLAGDVQFIEFVPTSDVARLGTDKRVALSQTDSLRLVFLWLNRSHQVAPPFVTGPNGEALTTNPLNDLRVRKALSMAINRNAIVERVMEGAAIPSNQFLAPGVSGHVADLAPVPFDIAAARALLAEAGYPKGFRITLHGPNDRYVNDGKIVQAIGQMWTRIGVETKVDAMTWTTYISRASKQEFSAFLLGWGISSGEASNPLRALVHTYDAASGWGSVNRGRYSNPQLDGMIKAAMAVADDKMREAALIDAERVAMEDVALIPIHIQKNIWAMRAGLTHTPRADERTLAMDLIPAP
ncbi:MAG: ABC transporter substrate-binding protein [Acetobacteraceae bacterium]|nr:ABC transporter substrate-binding protein [Acetobacteraceae bacterium]